MRAILAVAVATAMASGASGARPAPHRPVPLPAGTVVHAGAVSIQIDQVSNSQGIGNPIMTPSPGALMLVVTFTITNTTDEAIGVSDVPDLSLFRGTVKLVENKEKTESVQDTLSTSGYPGFGPRPRFLNPGVGYKDVAIFDVAKEGFDPSKLAIGFSIGGPTVMLPAVKHWPEDRNTTQ